MTRLRLTKSVKETAQLRRGSNTHASLELQRFSPISKCHVFMAVVILFWNFRYVPVAGFFLAYGGVGGINRKRIGHHRPVSGRIALPFKAAPKMTNLAGLTRWSVAFLASTPIRKRN